MAYSNQATIDASIKDDPSSLLPKLKLLGGNGLAKSVLRWTVLVGIFAYLFSKLSAIGWTNIIQSLPSSPVFYLLSVAFVFLPIVTERTAFQIATRTKSAPPLKIFIRKHVINKAVMNYAGEGYFIQQLSNLPGQDLRSAAIIVKNLAIVRTFVANFWVILLVFAAVILGNTGILLQIFLVSPVLIGVTSAICIGICFGALLFFRKLTRLDVGVAGKIGSIYLMRSFLAGCILIAQWSLVLPGTSLAVWFLFLLVFFVAKKSPIGGDLVFVSVALTLPGLNGDSAAIAAMLLTTAAVVQIIYSLGFAMTSDLLIPKIGSHRSAPCTNVVKTTG